MASKRKHSALSQPSAPQEPVDPSDEFFFLNLGGGNEVGKSCHIIQYKGKTIMLDAGYHPGREGHAGLPFFDDFDLSTIDVLLITHFHRDHSAALPYVLAKTTFRGRVIMTRPTKALYKHIIMDGLRLYNISQASAAEQSTQIYTEEDLLSTMPRIEVVEFNATQHISGMKITPYPAGHVLGAAMFLINIDGTKILFTGDYSRENDRHLAPAEVPKGMKIDVLITESTFGASASTPLKEREAELMRNVTDIVDRGGRALLPTFAAGEAQELLLLFEEFWEKNAKYQDIPIYFASGLAKKCVDEYAHYTDYMNEDIKRKARASIEGTVDGKPRPNGPWDLRFCRSLKSLDRFDDKDPCVMFASPGMLQTGVSRELLERWAPDARNGVIMTGYSVEGSMAKYILKEPTTIPARNAGINNSLRGGTQNQQALIQRRCTVKEVSFAVHVDGKQNIDFIEQCQASVVILVHGERHLMTRLRSNLLSLNAAKPADKKTTVLAPANCEEVRLPIRSEKTAQVVGQLARSVMLPPSVTGMSSLKKGEEANGYSNGPHPVKSAVLVKQDLKLTLMDPKDLKEFAQLDTTNVLCRRKITLAGTTKWFVHWALESAFGFVEEIGFIVNGVNGKVKSEKREDLDGPSSQQNGSQTQSKMRVMNAVTVTYRDRGEMEVEWEGNIKNDGIADAVLNVLLGAEMNAGSLKARKLWLSSPSQLNIAFNPFLFFTVVIYFIFVFLTTMYFKNY